MAVTPSSRRLFCRRFAVSGTDHMTLPALRGRPAPHGKASRVAGRALGRTCERHRDAEARSTEPRDRRGATDLGEPLDGDGGEPILRGRKTARLGPIGRRIQADTSATATTIVNAARRASSPLTALKTSIHRAVRDVGGRSRTSPSQGRTCLSTRDRPRRRAPAPHASRAARPAFAHTILSRSPFPPACASAAPQADARAALATAAVGR